MFSFKTIAFAALVMSLVAATPLPHHSKSQKSQKSQKYQQSQPSLQPQQVSTGTVVQQVKFCTEENFYGHCITNSWKQAYPCMNVDPDWVDTTSSFAIIDTRIKCTFYTGHMCTGTTYDVAAGTAPLNSLKSLGSDQTNFDKQLGSFACQMGP